MADMGPRPPGAAPRLSWTWTLALLVLVGCVGVVCALAVHSACVDPGPPVSRPDPGTPRADYCATADTPAARIATIAIALVATALGAVVSRRRPWWTLWVAAVATLALMANAVVASSLSLAYTI